MSFDSKVTLLLMEVMVTTVIMVTKCQAKKLRSELQPGLVALSKDCCSH